MCGQQLFGVALLRLTSIERTKIAECKYTFIISKRKENMVL